MKDDGSEWFFVLAVVWLWTFVSLEPRLNPESVNYADDVCKDNGGWKHIEEGYSFFSSVKCNNGAEFEYDWTVVQKEALEK